VVLGRRVVFLLTRVKCSNSPLSRTCDGDDSTCRAAKRRVTAFTVDHGNPPIAALGYRIEHGGRSVTISPDTRKSENLIRYARQTDVLVHEVMAAGPAAQAMPAFRERTDLDHSFTH
jgi:ribonuclease BN (tRNA processing enzyme)